MLTHWGHICISKLTIISSEKGLSSGWHQAIIWTNAKILLTGPWGTNFSEISIAIHTFSFKKMHLKISSGKWWPCCLGFNVLTKLYIFTLVPNSCAYLPMFCCALITLDKLSQCHGSWYPEPLIFFFSILAVTLHASLELISWRPNDTHMHRYSNHH